MKTQMQVKHSEKKHVPNLHLTLFCSCLICWERFHHFCSWTFVLHLQDPLMLETIWAQSSSSSSFKAPTESSWSSVSGPLSSNALHHILNKQLKSKLNLGWGSLLKTGGINSLDRWLFMDRQLDAGDSALCLYDWTLQTPKWFHPYHINPWSILWWRSL